MVAPVPENGDGTDERGVHAHTVCTLHTLLFSLGEHIEIGTAEKRGRAIVGIKSCRMSGLWVIQKGTLIVKQIENICAQIIKKIEEIYM